MSDFFDWNDWRQQEEALNATEESKPPMHNGMTAHDESNERWQDRYDALTKELAAARAEVERLKECLEPGKASAIVHGMFTEAQRLGFYRPTAKHALTQFVEHVEHLREQLATCRETLLAAKPSVIFVMQTDSRRNANASAVLTQIEQALESAGPPPKT
jgi:phosphoglycolate phosphatase-like HAD superfamily hydrolase